MQYSLRNMFIAILIMLLMILALIITTNYLNSRSNVFLNTQGLSILRLGLIVVAVSLVGFLIFLYRKMRLSALQKPGNGTNTSIGQQLNDREAQLNLIYNATTDGMLLLSVEKNGYRIVSANNTFLSGYDIQEERVVGKFVPEIIGKPSLEIYLLNLDKSVNEKKTREWEADFTLRSETVTAEFSSTPVINKNGVCDTLVVTIHDITQRKKTELQLQKAESKFRNLVEKSLVGVYIIKDEKFVYINPHLAGIFGYSKGELIEADPRMIIHPDDREMVMENISARVLGLKDHIHYEARGLHKDGRIVNVEILCSGVLQDEGQAIIGTLLNITERKFAETGKMKALKQLNERVKELTVLNQVSSILQQNEKDSASILKEIVEILPSGWEHPDLAGVRLIVGDNEYKTDNFRIDGFKLTSERVIGDSLQVIIEISYPQTGMPKAWTNFLEEERNMLNTVSEIIKIYLRKNQEEIARQEMERSMLNQRIQEQKKITRAILNAQESTRNKIGQEIHDNVNQILVSVKLYLGLALDEPAEKSKPLIENSHRYVTTAIDELRKLSSNEVTPVKKMNLQDLIETLIEMLEDSTSIKVKFDFDPGRNLDLEEDLKLNIYRIIQEQINNILKYAEATQVEISVKSVDDNLVIRVKDNGKGFDPGQRRTGIGISNMINRVESFNGTLSIQSTPGTGCELYISLPIESELFVNNRR